MSKRTKFSKEVRERAVWMLVEHEREYGSRWEAYSSSRQCC